MKTAARRVIPKGGQIRELVEECLKVHVIGIERVEIGRDSVTFKALSTTGTVFIRTGGKRKNYDVEAAVLQLVRKAGMKAPKPIALDVSLSKYPFQYLMLEEMPGFPLEGLAVGSWPPFLEQAGEELAKMYAIKLEGFGNPDAEMFRRDGKLVGKYQSWYKVLSSSHLKCAKSLEAQYKKTGFMDAKLSYKQRTQLCDVVRHLDVLRRKAEDARGNLDINPGRIIHKDIHSDHIFVKDGKVTGIIDFNNASSGDPLYDIATFSLMKGGNYYPHLIKKSDIKFEENLFHLYRLLHAVGKIHFRLEEGYLNKAPAVLNIALEELKRKKGNL